MVMRAVSFDPRSGSAPTKPSPVRPGPARPWRPPCAPSSPLSHLDFPRSNLPLPLPPLSPRGALGIGNGDHRNLDPEVSSPPLPFSSLSLSLLFSPCARPLFSLHARAPTLPVRRRRGPALPSLLGGGADPALPCLPGVARRGLRPPARPPVQPPAQPLARPGVAPGAAPARPRPPARGVSPLGVARVALAWPRAPPFTTNAFPRNPRAR
jgi:hypothetical protein